MYSIHLMYRYINLSLHFSLPKTVRLHPQLFCPRDLYSEVFDTMIMLLSFHGLTRNTCSCEGAHIHANLSLWTYSCFIHYLFQELFSSPTLWIIPKQIRMIVARLTLPTVSSQDKRCSVWTTVTDPWVRNQVSHRIFMVYL